MIDRKNGLAKFFPNPKLLCVEVIGTGFLKWDKKKTFFLKKTPLLFYSYAILELDNLNRKITRH